MGDEDNTVVMDMKREFQKFVSNEDHRKRTRLEMSQDASFLDATQSSMSSMKGDSLLTKTDLIYCKTRIGMLEAQLNSKETELKEQAVLHDKELEELRRKHDKEMRAYNVMKTSHERVLHRQEICERERDEAKENLVHVKQVFEDKVRQLQTKNMDLEFSYTEMLDEQKAKCRELKNKLLTQQADYSVVCGELEQYKDQLQDTKKKLHEIQVLNVDDLKLKASSAEERVRVLEAELQSYHDDKVILKARKQDLLNLSKLKEDNKKLQSQLKYYQATTENIEVMKEKMQTMERRLQHHEDLQRNAGQLKVENESLRRKVQELQQNRIPEETVIRLKEAQQQQAVMLHNLGELKSKNRMLEEKVQQLEQARSGLKMKLSGSGDEDDRKKMEIERLQRKVLILSRERDGFQKIVASYDADVTREVVPLTSDKNSQLQDMINNYRKLNEHLEQDLQNKDLQITQLKQRVTELETMSESQIQSAFTDTNKEAASSTQNSEQDMLLDLRKKIAELESMCEKLQEEKNVLECRIEQRHMQGDYDPTKTKVLHFTMNPSAIAEKLRADEVQRLKDDNKRLKERVRILEQRLQDAHNLTVQVEANLQNTDDSELLKEAKAQISSEKQKFERAMEVFKKNSMELRQSCYQLTGYRIDVPKSGQYKLMNMYSSSPEDYLLFQDVDEALCMLETPFASTLTELAEEYLHSQNSIPAFLSALTLDLYRQQTMASTFNASVL